VEVDAAGWSGDGALTQAIVACLRSEPRIVGLRVEDAPASREDTAFTFISNEIFIRPAVEWRRASPRGWRLWRVSRPEPALTLADVEARLSRDPAIAAPDFSDDGMLQYLRAERIVPPFQTRGYKLVELVRIYMSAIEPSR
jgi:hypothetical protein